MHLKGSHIESDVAENYRQVAYRYFSCSRFVRLAVHLLIIYWGKVSLHSILSVTLLSRVYQTATVRRYATSY
jgi:hypothetical protein